MTAKARREAAAKRQISNSNVRQDLRPNLRQTKTLQASPHAEAQCKAEKVRIARSKIPNAGLGLYLLEDVKKGEFVARYSGEAIDSAENAARKGHYRIKISNNLYLDAECSHHFEEGIPTTANERVKP